MTEIIHPVSVEVVGDHCLRLRFEDGTEGEVDFTTRSWGGIFQPLADPDYFKRVEVDPELGTIVWPNGADIAPEALYERAVGGEAAPT